jgi:TRAP-type C4-dicarboxylate transport system permease small subunit
MDAAEAPAPPPTGLAGLARRLDDGVLKIEQLLVTLAALVMTTTVTLDIVFRSFVSDESILARKLLTVASWFGLTKTEENYVILRDYGTPALLALLAFLCGWAMFTSARKRSQRPRPVGLALAWGAFVLALSWGLVQFVLHVPSRWVCFTFLVGGALAYGVYAAMHRDVFGALLTGLVAAAGGWLCLKLPEGYIWSQELSLILLAWMAFLGGSMATRFEKHIQVDALSKLVPGKLRPWTRALGLAVTTAFCVYMTLLCYEQVFGPKGDFASGEIRPATGLPAWVIVMAALVAFILMSVRFLARTVDAFVHPKQPEVGVPH